MSVTKKKISVLSSDSIHTLKGYIYLPDKEPLGILHVVHGMTEHIGRYDHLMNYFAELGFIVAGYDHLGHGNTATNGEFGFFAKKNGYRYLVDDVHIFGEKLRKNNKNLPYYLFGHSMGSFIVRLAEQKYPNDIDKLIICGTGGPNPLANIGLLLADILMLFKGKKGYSPFIESMAFGAYNKNFKDENDSKAWLTKDKEIREIYAADTYCKFSFTISALHDLVKMNKLCNTDKWFKHYRKDLPTLIVSGDKDPVGDNGKGVTKVYNKLKKAGVNNLTFKLYENCRHEIHNDTSKEQMFADIEEFLK